MDPAPGPIVIDFREWAKGVKAMMETSSKTELAVGDYAVPGCRLIRRLTAWNSGAPEGLGLRIDEEDCYRVSAREWHSLGVNPVEWWANELRALFADTLCAKKIKKTSGRGQEVVYFVRRLEGGGTGEGVELSEEEELCLVTKDFWMESFMKTVEEEAGSSVRPSWLKVIGGMGRSFK